MVVNFIQLENLTILQRSEESSALIKYLVTSVKEANLTFNPNILFPLCCR